MSNPNRTAYEGPPLTGPGIMWVNSVPKPQLEEKVFNQWYQEVHIPDIVNAKPGDGCVAAWRFKSQNPTRPRPYLALYAVPDMSFIQSPEFGEVSQYHEMLPEGGPSQKFVDFDTRFYRRTQTYEKEEEDNTGFVPQGIGRVVKSTAMQPAPGMSEELDRWYREEHLGQVAAMPGWRRSTRYELIFKVQSKDDPSHEEAPRYLAIHEFDEGTKIARMPREQWTEWTTRMVESAELLDEGTFTYVWGTRDEHVGL
ncbi:hypothetical protein K491DRAFT_686435 [Lophiostoma macrostomum CBS 122681]|uniref:ABM domain-containing protein n=1 Tax=Lophiostoma macrostomum CBS 122681 TaxID=1314788 RepID=A0A6A6TUB1_9PLEO|nr:hypothetical protein K491DRAFT_686435 [Lophiostoma macrostomum CBS 122681]